MTSEAPPVRPAEVLRPSGDVRSANPVDAVGDASAATHDLAPDRSPCPVCATGFATVVRRVTVPFGLRRDRRCAGCGHVGPTIEIACANRPAPDSALIEAASTHLAAALRALNLVASKGTRQKTKTFEARRFEKRRQADSFFTPSTGSRPGGGTR